MIFNIANEIPYHGNENRRQRVEQNNNNENGNGGFASWKGRNEETQREAMMQDSPILTRDSSICNRSSSIPLPSSHVTRTQSEMQLCMDQAAAEQRDAIMFYRLVRGIRERQQQQQQQQMLSKRMTLPYLTTQYTQAPFPIHNNEAIYKNKNNNNATALPTLALGQKPDTHCDSYAEEGVDSWSITGFEPVENAHWFNQTNYIADDDDASASEEGIFSMDL